MSLRFHTCDKEESSENDDGEMCSEAVLWQNFGEAAERLVRSRVGNQEALQGGMSESCAHIPALGAPGCGVRTALWLLESMAARSRLFNQALATCCYCLYKNNKSFQIFITLSCAEERVPCI